MASNIKFFDLRVNLNHENCKYFCVPEEIKSKSELFHAYAVGLCAPNSYFGESWSAFEDMALDLDWLGEKKILIIHTDIPMIKLPESKIYIEILDTVSGIWGGNRIKALASEYPDFKAHEFEVFFPKEYEKYINEFL